MQFFFPFSLSLFSLQTSQGTTCLLFGIYIYFEKGKQKTAGDSFLLLQWCFPTLMTHNLLPGWKHDHKCMAGWEKGPSLPHCLGGCFLLPTSTSLLLGMHGTAQAGVEAQRLLRHSHRHTSLHEKLHGFLLLTKKTKSSETELVEKEQACVCLTMEEKTQSKMTVLADHLRANLSLI